VLLDALVELSFSVHDVLARVAARYDVSVTQVRLFGTLRDREPTMSDLKDHLALEKSSVSGLIDRAERRGLVARTTGHPDGRTVHVRLTEQGVALATRFADAVYAELETLLAPLSDREQRRLFELAGAVSTAQASLGPASVGEGERPRALDAVIPGPARGSAPSIKVRDRLPT
jgi:MarR family transcriptional regulator, lower aerobic nicotinate degradation pathway regulator